MIKDYTSMSKAELQTLLKKRKVVFKKSDKRDDLIAMAVATEAPKVVVKRKGDSVIDISILAWLCISAIAIVGIAISVIK